MAVGNSPSGLYKTYLQLYMSISMLSTLVASQNPSSGPASTGLFHDIDVGKDGLVFEPDTLYATVGDVVNFHFFPINHSVAQSSFDKPCAPLEGGVGQIPIFSGFIPAEEGEAPKMFSMHVNNSDPIWLYCSQTYHDHCQAGQVMVINPTPDSDQTLVMYTEAAKNANTSSPSDVFGGLALANSRSDTVAQTATTSISSSSMGTSATSHPSASSSLSKRSFDRTNLSVVFFVFGIGLLGIAAV